VPEGISDEDASQYLINPFTVVGLVDTLEIPKGEYLLQTAAGTIT
jgi:trans-2-enoyl-CoA reductase